MVYNTYILGSFFTQLHIFFSAFSNLAGLDAEGHFAAQLGIQAGKLLHVYSF